MNEERRPANSRSEHEQIGLAEAGRRLRRSYNQVQRLVMLGHITGGRDESGRWWVSASDVKALSDAMEGA